MGGRRARRPLTFPERRADALPVQATGRRTSTRLPAAYAAAVLIPVVLDATLGLSGLDYEEVGSSCSSLTDASRRAFDAKIVWLQLSLVVWALTGAFIIAREWLGRLERGAARTTVLAGWALGSAAAAYAAWIGPASGGFARALLLVIYAPGVLIVTAALMVAPLVVRRARRRLAMPVGLVLASLAQLAVVLVAACLLGGTGEVEVC